MKRTNTISRAVLATALTGLLLSTGGTLESAYAFRLTGGAAAGAPPHVWPGMAVHLFAHWDLRELPGCEVPWSRGAGTTDIGGAGEFVEIKQAFSTWGAVAPSHLGFNEVATPAGALPAGNLDGNNIVDFGGGLGAATLAVTTTWFNVANGRIGESDIRFNDTNYNWKVVGHNVAMGGDPDVQTVALHEIGHFFGLDHATAGGTSNPPGPIMNPFLDLTLNSNHRTSPDDEDGINFLYNHDLGDAPDPDPICGVIGQYPTLVHDVGAGRTLNGVTLDGRLQGAEHIFGIRERQPGRNYTYEWLGFDMDSECEADVVDRDRFDDGIRFFPNPPLWGKPAFVAARVVQATDAVGNQHDYSAATGLPMFLNMWLDGNQNCNWEHPGERIVTDSFNFGPLAGPNATQPHWFVYPLPLPGALPNPRQPIWLRARLDWGENSGGVNNVDGTLSATRGAAQFGEVEDYPLGCPEPIYWNILIPTPQIPIPRDGMQLRVFGDATVDNGTQWFIADSNAEDCYDLILPSDFVQTTFVPSANETIVEVTGGGPVPVGEYLHIGYCPPITPIPTPLVIERATWQSEGLVTQEDWIPTPNVQRFSFPFDGRDHIVVGALDQESGGFLGGRMDDGEWQDHMQVEVSYWISPQKLELPQLSPCDPALLSLTKRTAGVMTIDPEHPLEFDIPHDADYDPATDYVVLEMKCRWDLSTIETTALCQFLGVEETSNTPEQISTNATRLELAASPNPTRGASTLHFRLPETSKVSLAVFDTQGRLVRSVLTAATMDAGEHQVRWDGRDSNGITVPSGVYYTRLQAGDASVSRSVLVTR